MVRINSSPPPCSVFRGLLLNLNRMKPCATTFTRFFQIFVLPKSVFPGWVLFRCFWLGWLVCLVFSAPVQAQKLDPRIKRIVFLGNSITYSGGYVTAIEAYLVTRYPDRDFEIINVGLPSETVSGLSEPDHADGRFPRPDLQERLQRVLEGTQPDLVFAGYGMNDGIYLPYDADRFRKFQEGINRLHAAVEQTGARIIHLTPPDFDEQRGKSPGYSAVLDRYSDWLLSMRSAARWEVIDVHYPMKKYLAAHRQVDRRFGLDGFALAADGVHPGETGHWLMAREVLKYLGFKEVVRSPGIAESLAGIPNGNTILKLVADRQVLMRDAWLTVTRHQRPGLPAGMPLAGAQAKYAAIQQELKERMKQK
jgi:lysophospholipase L1-like esterase